VNSGPGTSHRLRFQVSSSGVSDGILLAIRQRLRSFAVGTTNRPDTLLRVSLWAMLVAAVSFTRADPDLWGHVQFGLDILRDATIPRHDPYSFTSDRPWVNHEWAAEVFMGIGYLLGGAVGLVLLKLILVGGFVALLHAAIRRVANSRVRDSLGGLAVIMTVQQAHHVRPQVWSLLLFAALLTCLIGAQRGKPRLIYALPVIFGAWVNFHGGWILGGGVLILWTVGVWAQRGIREARAYLAVGIISFLATLVNPYGPGMWIFLLQTVGFGRADITDWQPIYALDASVWLLWCLTLGIAAVGCIEMIRRRGFDLARVLIVAALAVASFQVNRLLAFFALATLFLLGGEVSLALSRPPRTARGETKTVRTLAVALAAVLIVGAAVVTAMNLSWIRIDSRITPPPGAVSFLEAQRGGRLIVWFDWGQYAIWHLAPDFKVSTDGRRETVYSADLHERHLRFFFDAPGGGTLPDQVGADWIWLPQHLQAVQRLASTAEWTKVYADDISVIFRRASAATFPHRPAFTATSYSRRFPGP
jgi:hypothetical protein